MIRDCLVNLFGENEQVTLDMAKKMKYKIFENLYNNRKEEYQSKVGIAILIDCVGGQLTPAMRDSMAKVREYKSTCTIRTTKHSPQS